MKQLEQIVQEMESGDLPLEKAIQKFEEGIRLTRYCTEKLDETEKRVTLLMDLPAERARPAEQRVGADPESRWHTSPDDCQQLISSCWWRVNPGLVVVQRHGCGRMRHAIQAAVYLHAFDAHP